MNYGEEFEKSIMESKIIENIEFEEKKAIASKDDNKYNYCKECNLAMVVIGSRYRCSQCNKVSKISISSVENTKTTTSGAIRINCGKNKGTYYSVHSDYTKTQYKSIISQLTQNQITYTGNTFPMNVLIGAAQKYNSIQKEVLHDVYDKQGNVIGQKKFVRRRDIKNEVLAALIYYTFIEEGIIRKKKDIATFMKLPSDGMSRGENILLDLYEMGKIDLPIDDEPIAGFVDRYFEILNIDTKWSKFIVDMVNHSEKKNLGMNSHISSKVVAVIWLLINKVNLPITAKQLGKSADDIKKATFMKFYNIILANEDIFMEIYVKHGIGS